MTSANPSVHGSSHRHVAHSTLPKPGPIGRLIRLAFGMGVLALLWGVLAAWRADMWAGRLPFDLGFLVLVCLALYLTSYVFNIAFRFAWGQWTLVGVLVGAGVAALAGYALQGQLLNTFLGVYLWLWFVVFCALFGPALVLASALGTPGCEMRSYAHLAARFRGGDAGAVACPGGIDRFDKARGFLGNQRSNP